jgi:hypothetical protein
MRLPKTIAGISIILIVLLPCLYCLYFQVKHHLIREEMREKLERDNLQTVIIPVNEFRWYEEDREIIVDGTMFDVKTIARRGDNYIITGLFDEAETELHIAMGRLQQKEGEGPDPETISLVLSVTFMPPSCSNVFEWMEDDDLSSKKAVTDEQLYNTAISILTPPPRI